MNNTLDSKREAWATIATFMAILIALSAIAQFAIVKLNPVSIYVGALMCCPALAAILTIKIKGRGLSELRLKWGGWRSTVHSYLIPVVYISAAYCLAWTFGFAGVPNSETIAEWGSELGLSGMGVTASVVVMVGLLATIQFIKSLGTIVGEELGWRGFLVWELRKVMPFSAICLTSGVIWSLWHLPIVVTYGGGNPWLQMTNFTIMIVSMSVIMTYYTFKSNSVWPAVMFHAAHNIYVQKIFTPLSTRNDNTSFWIDEYGILVPAMVAMIAVVYWRRANTEEL